MRASRATALLFIAFIVAPLGANVLGVDGANSRVENRTMAPFPRLALRWDAMAALPSGFASWFEDHFGFRSTLVRWLGELRYFGLGVSPAAGVVRGEDGWLFYGGDAGLDDYVRETLLRADEVEGWRESLVRSHAWLRARGVAFVFAIAPDKHVLYPEALPDSIQPVGHAYRMDQVYAALEGTGVPTVDVRPALRAAKSRERLYEKTDTHWSGGRSSPIASSSTPSAGRCPPCRPPGWPTSSTPWARTPRPWTSPG